MKNLLTLIVVLTLAACSSGDNVDSNTPNSLTLDGIYRGSPIIVSANGFTYDYEIPPGSPVEFYGTTGRVYTTTVNGNAVSGTATIYNNADVTTATLTGSIDEQGNLDLTFIDGANSVVITARELMVTDIVTGGRAWCSISISDNVTVHGCGEFDVLGRITFRTPSHGPGSTGTSDLVTVTLTQQVDTNVYEASVDWEVCNGNGVVGFADAEDNVHDEAVIAIVGSCNFVWWRLLGVQ